MYKKANDILWNEEFFFWLINGKIKRGKLNFNSNLQDLAEFLLFEYHIERNDYSKVEFSFQDTIYDDFNLKLADIGFISNYLFNVKKEIFPTFPLRPCTLHDRDHYTEYLDGIRFEILLINKINFILEKCLSIIELTGVTFIEALKRRLVDTDNKFEISTVQKTIDEIPDLTQKYLTDIRKSLRKIE